MCSVFYTPSLIQYRRGLVRCTDMDPNSTLISLPERHTRMVEFMSETKFTDYNIVYYNDKMLRKRV